MPSNLKPEDIRTIEELRAFLGNALSLRVRLFKKNPTSAAWQALELTMLAYQQVAQAEHGATILARWSADPNPLSLGRWFKHVLG